MFRVTKKASGEAVQGTELFVRAWNECVELQCTPELQWCSTVLAELSELDRYEVCIFVGDAPVGGIILVHDEDWHVGTCLTVAFQYVLPEFRNTGVSIACMRFAKRLARELGYKALAYSHRKGPWRYEIIYRRINEQTTQA